MFPPATIQVAITLVGFSFLGICCNLSLSEPFGAWLVVLVSTLTWRSPSCRGYYADLFRSFPWSSGELVPRVSDLANSEAVANGRRTYEGVRTDCASACVYRLPRRDAVTTLIGIDTTNDHQERSPRKNFATSSKGSGTSLKKKIRDPQGHRDGRHRCP